MVMTPVISMAFLGNLALVSALVWLFYGPWQWFLVDFTRQRLFELRDSLFDMAADGQIKFQDPAYRHLRDMLNGWIRQNHAMTWYRLVAFVVLARSLWQSPVPESVVEFNTIADHNTRLAVEKIVQQAILIQMVSLNFRSLAMILLTPVAWLMLGVLVLFTRITQTIAPRRWFVRLVGAVDGVARDAEPIPR